MTERFCLNDDGDCPCFVIIRNSELFQSGIVDWFWQCRLFPEHKEFTTDPRRHYCYTGRQIMEQQATWNALKSCYPKEAQETEGGELK